jgi:L-ascorbate metabolism protein UlaG (beta-lactamase superfamily)
MTILTVTRIAHATTLIDFDGHVILTDPWFCSPPEEKKVSRNQ